MHDATTEILEIHRAIGEGTEHGTAYDAAKKRAECPEILVLPYAKRDEISMASKVPMNADGNCQYNEKSFSFFMLFTPVVAHLQRAGFSTRIPLK